MRNFLCIGFIIGGKLLVVFIGLLACDAWNAYIELLVVSVCID